MTGAGLRQRVRPTVVTDFLGGLCRPRAQVRLKVAEVWMVRLHSGQQGSKTFGSDHRLAQEAHFNPILTLIDPYRREIILVFFYKF